MSHEHYRRFRIVTKYGVSGTLTALLRFIRTVQQLDINGDGIVLFETFPEVAPGSGQLQRRLIRMAVPEALTRFPQSILGLLPGLG